MEISCRQRANLNQDPGGIVAMRLVFGDYELDTTLFELRREGQNCPLEPQVFDVLTYLAEHCDRIITRQELFDTLWAGRIVTDATLSSCIKAARKAIGDNGRDQRCIATLHRRGYRFVVDVKSHADAIVPPAKIAPALPIVLPDDAAIAIADSPILFPLAPESEPDRPAIAVIPFAHNHGDDYTAWHADVLGEDISLQLARIPGFVVISRNSTASYRGREIGIRQIGSELGCRYLVEGSVWAIAKQLRVSVQLIDTNDGHVLWARRTEAAADTINELQVDIVREIVGRIEPELSRAEFASLRTRRPVDLCAWALYRQGHATLNLMGWSEQSFDRCANLMRRAIVRDPDLAFAHAYLALVLAIGHLVGLVSGAGWREEATAAAERAITLDNQDSDILGYAGCAFADMGDPKRGMNMLRQAVELDPSNAQARAGLGAVMLKLGLIQGIEEMRQGIRISPRDNRRAAWGAVLASGLLHFGRVAEAIEVADNACRCDDKIFLPRVVLAIAHCLQGNLPAARNAISEARRIRPGLSMEDIGHFATPDALTLVKRASLL